MISPVSDEPMLVLELHEVEIDYCPATGGVWLDDGELELLLDDPEAAEHILESGRRAEGVAEAARKCPITGQPMEKWRFGGEPGILVDRSAAGHGFWFDRGELRQLLRLGGDTPRTKAVIDFLNEMFPMNADEAAPEGASKGD